MIELTMAIFQPHLGQVGAFSSNVLKSPGRQGLEPRFMGLAPHLWWGFTWDESNLVVLSQHSSWAHIPIWYETFFCNWNIKLVGVADIPIPILYQNSWCMDQHGIIPPDLSLRFTWAAFKTLYRHFMMFGYSNFPSWIMMMPDIFGGKTPPLIINQQGFWTLLVERATPAPHLRRHGCCLHRGRLGSLGSLGWQRQQFGKDGLSAQMGDWGSASKFANQSRHATVCC